MKQLLIFIIGASILFANIAIAQSSMELDKLNSNSGLMIATGTVFTATGLAFIGVGAKYLTSGNQPVSMAGTGVTGYTNGTRTGIIFTTTGSILAVGGATLLAFGLKTRREYKTKKATLTVGYLDTGTLGLQARF